VIVLILITFIHLYFVKQATTSVYGIRTHYSTCWYTGRILC